MATRTKKKAAETEQELWSEAERAEVREDLLARREELQAEYEQSMETLREYQETARGEGVDDSGDAGSNTYEREQQMSLANNNRDLILQVDHALARLDEGTYGICETCGKPIAKARLQAFPSATECVTCKQRGEAR